MTIAPAALFGPLQVPDTQTVIYSVPANTTVVVTRIVATNVTAGAIGLTLWIVRAGNSVVNGNIVVGAVAAGQSISAGPSEPYVVNAMASLMLNAGDAIWGKASAANSLNIVGSGNTA